MLIDAVNQARERGLDKIDAIVEAGRARLRPILITTLTTILGLVPMAIGIGEGAEVRAPMAITVIGGLTLDDVPDAGRDPGRVRRDGPQGRTNVPARRHRYRAAPAPHAAAEPEHGPHRASRCGVR